MQLTIFDALLDANQRGSCGKMSPESCLPKTTPLVPSWADWQAAMPPSSTQEAGQVRVWLPDPAASSHGARWMPSFLEWPSAADVSLCSLSQVLEDGPLPTRFYLSPRAAAGILRRAGQRRKNLPQPLEKALESVAASK